MTHRQIMIGLSLIVAALASACGARNGAPQTQTAPPPPSNAVAQTPTVQIVAVVSQELNRQLRLPGELQPFQDVALYAKVPGFVETINVDRGSVVKEGQLLIRMSVPELATQYAEAEAKVRVAQSQRVEAESRVQSVRAQRLEAEAKLSSDDTTYQRLKAASATPGVVAGNDVDIARQTVEADRARIQLWNENEKAAQAQMKTLAEGEQALREGARSVQNIESYLRIAAPFDGIITERNVHKGSFAGQSAGSAPPMLRIQQVSRLRLTVPVPEIEVAGLSSGAKVNFTVPAFPGETFSGTIARIGHSLDAKTRTMPVELDVANPAGRLAPGMFPEVNWPTRRPHPSLFVPPSAVAVTTERAFVIRIRDGVTEWVDVKRGATMGDLIEVFGHLDAGDQVALRGTDELRAGTRVTVKQAAPNR